MLIGQLPAPVIAGISPDTGTNANDGVTNAASVTLSGSAEPNDTITLYDNGSLAGSTTANAAGLWSAAGVALTEGSNALTAVAHDQAGDVSSAGSFLATRDSTPPIAPTISGISPDTGPSDSDGITDTGQLSIDGTAEAGSTVAVYDGATRIGIATADGLGAWSLTPAPLAQGSHGLTATATDLAGNASAASPDFTVKVQYPPVLLQSVLSLTVGEGQSLGNLWSQVITNGQDLDQASLTVSAVAATGALGTIAYDPAQQVLSYLASGADPAQPVDSFSYTLTDDQGMSITGTVAVTVTGPDLPTTVVTTAGATVSATGAGQRLISEASGQTLVGTTAGGDEFFGSADTEITAAGNGNVIYVAPGTHGIAMGASNNSVTLGDGNNGVSATGTGDSVTGGKGNTIVTGMQGSATIVLGDGNDGITISGANNSVTVGTGTDRINPGVGGNEHVVAGNGANNITLGGANDVVTVGNGTNLNSFQRCGGDVHHRQRQQHDLCHWRRGQHHHRGGQRHHRGDGRCGDNPGGAGDQHDQVRRFRQPGGEPGRHRYADRHRQQQHACAALGRSGTGHHQWQRTGKWRCLRPADRAGRHGVGPGDGRPGELPANGAAGQQRAGADRSNRPGRCRCVHRGDAERQRRRQPELLPEPCANKLMLVGSRMLSRDIAETSREPDVKRRFYGIAQGDGDDQ